MGWPSNWPTRDYIVPGLPYTDCLVTRLYIINGDEMFGVNAVSVTYSMSYRNFYYNALSWLGYLYNSYYQRQPRPNCHIGLSQVALGLLQIVTEFSIGL